MAMACELPLAYMHAMSDDTPLSASPQSRAGLLVSGPDAPTFLDGLLTVNVTDLEPDRSRYGALLSPQGKIQYELFIHRTTEGVVLELPAGDLAPKLGQRLALLKLRADVTVSNLDTGELTRFGPDHDPRVSSFHAPPIPTDLATRRVELALPQQGLDYGFEEVFLTDVNMDLLNGVNFKKGCFIGQEVASRMRRRGTIRKRTFAIVFDGPAPDPGAPVNASAGPAIGRITSTSNDFGLAILRTDRLVGAGGLSATLTAGDTPCRAVCPPYASAEAIGLVKEDAAS